MIKKNYLTPLNIPSQTREGFAIVQEKYPPNHVFQLNTIRTRMFGGQKGGTISWPHETTWHQLLINGARMMSDWPIEQKQILDCLKRMRGRVLVGGLGLGLATTFLLKRRTVYDVVVVEVAEEVIEMVGPYCAPSHKHKMDIRQADLLQWLEEYKGPPFDYAFYDIWASDGEGTFFETVCPLYELSRGKVKHQPVNWNEDVMRGQLYHSLQSREWFSNMTPEEREHIKAPEPNWDKEVEDKPGFQSYWHNWSVPYFKWLKERKPDEKLAQAGRQFYSGIYGTWNWQENWQNLVVRGTAK